MVGRTVYNFIIPCVVLGILFLIWSILYSILKISSARSRARKLSQRCAGREQFYRDMEDSTGEVCLLLQREDLTPLYVGGTERVFGISSEEVCKDLNVLEKIMEPSDRRKLLEGFRAWEEDAARSRSCTYTFRTDTTDGPAWYTADISLSADKKRLLCSLHDSTALQGRILELEKAASEAEQEVISKTHFLSQMSHEIRTPMNGILGMLTLSKKTMGRLDESCADLPQMHSIAEYLEKAEGLSQFLLGLINDILDMSRIESGRIELAQESFDLRSFADKLRTMFQKTVEEKGVQFKIEMLDFTVHHIIGDELRLSQVIVNFLSNAGKFTSSGGSITVTFRQMDLQRDRVHLMIRVRDTGKGISREFLKNIFKPFVQENATIAKNYGGSGLGMAIADNMVRLMGGQIVVDSELGKGSDFSVYVSFPVDFAAEKEEQAKLEAAGSSAVKAAVRKESTEEEIREAMRTLGIASEEEIGSAYRKKEEASDGRRPPEERRIEGMRLLMAEDNEVNAEIAVALLEDMGAQVEVAVNGRLAVEAFTASEPGRYDTILMDIQMPEMNGWEAAAAIRALERPDAKTIPIYALSADAFVEDKRHSVEIGMNGHISKPIDFDELERTIGR